MADDRASRSVFVGNIPYEATEEALREIFCQVGSVVSFRLVYDRETGKPKGYGFCEYQDVETAQSAMRNLNNHDFSGRQLRVGIAAGEQSKEEGKSVQQSVAGPFVESPYGEPVESEKAPEAISRAVASLPPEQMFELMKQMKLCIQNNPNEARNMLLQNPQLAYALLQAQIVMKIVDPQVALAMLHRQVEQIPPVQPTSTTGSSTTQSSQPGLPQLDSRLPHGAYASPVGDGSMANFTGPLGGPGGPLGGPGGAMGGGPPGVMGGPLMQGPGREGFVGPRAEFGPGGPVGAVAPRPRGGLLGDMPPVGPPGGMGPRGHVPDQLGPMRPEMGMRGDFPGGPMDVGPRGPVGPVRIAPVPRDPVDPSLTSAAHMTDPRLAGMMDSRSGPRPEAGLDPRSRGLGPSSGSMGQPRGDVVAAPLRPEVRDPRQSAARLPVSSAAARSNISPSQSSSGAPAAAGGVSKQDQEKAQLIMQVLQLSDEQIAMLPPDQRQSILILKEQIARSAQSS